MIAIVDYGVGNLFSVKRSFEAIGQDSIITGDKNVIHECDRILLPGVGAFRDAANKLFGSGLADVIVEETKNGKPLLGICLGMQLLFDASYEYGEHKGLGLIPGNIKPISDFIPNNYKVPQMGWNNLNIVRTSPLFNKIKNGDCVYFVHSYHATDCQESVIATTDYGCDITASVNKDNIYGCQFHPEKSGTVGLNILKAFCEDI